MVEVVVESLDIVLAEVAAGLISINLRSDVVLDAHPAPPAYDTPARVFLAPLSDMRHCKLHTLKGRDLRRQRDRLLTAHGRITNQTGR
jgi:hypothetical protein